ncbi:30S ribosomal protein S17 [Candidatus Kuenenbacteria bacterium]|nr:30S ribosomal protein S17 [Candidatus Kuenenbacteria bacterium]
MEKKIKRIFRRFTGVVTSTKMDKTAVVLVERIVMHKRYKKQYKVSRKYKVHDEKNQVKVGEKVKFEECRPLSKDKRWRIV